MREEARQERTPLSHPLPARAGELALAPGAEPLATFGTLDPLKIHPLDQIRRDRETALWAGLVQRRQHFFSVEFS